MQRTSRCKVEIFEFGMRADEEFAVCGLLEPADLVSLLQCYPERRSETYQQNFVFAKGWVANCGRISFISSRRLCSMSAESVCVGSSYWVRG